MRRPLISDNSGTASTPARKTGYVADRTNFHDLEMTSITGEQVTFDQYKGNLALVVNVASA